MSKKQEQKALETINNNEEVVKAGMLNEIIYHGYRRENKTLRISQDFEFCPSMTEQHSGHLTDINYLMERYRPDELAAYIAARNQHRQEIIGHDFSAEPTLQEAKNATYELQQKFQQLPDDIRRSFNSPLEFLKFVDNPQNEEKLIKLGLMTKKEVTDYVNTATATTQEAAKPSEPIKPPSKES